MVPRAKVSAGLLLYRRKGTGIEVLLVHPGGPFFARKDAGIWTIPKGEPEPGEALLACAQRELAEELGLPPPTAASYVALGSCRQRGGKVVHAFACESDLPLDDADHAAASSFELEWPPRSGQLQRFPEIDAAGYFDLATARSKINPAQQVFLDRLLHWRQTHGG